MSSPSRVKPSRVGQTDSPNAKIVRIVHISDTHLNHEQYLSEGLIPNGDVLVHSGDFSKVSISNFLGRDHRDEIRLLNEFFARLPHRYKIFIAGNHEKSFVAELNSDQKRISELLTECIYLQDSSVTIEGIKFYGTPWNGIRQDSIARAFADPYGPILAEHWNDIPSDTNVLVTHNPPFGILDLGVNGLLTMKDEPFCDQCKQLHKGQSHYGCPQLKRHVIDRIRPAVHLFGHAHESGGTLMLENILFSNAALTVAVIDYFVDATVQSQL